MNYRGTKKRRIPQDAFFFTFSGEESIRWSMFFEGKAFYFIGIGGVSMSALARLLRDRGARVRGSDRNASAYTRALGRAGIPVCIGEDEEITEENVVYTGAVREDHPQLCAARAAGKHLIPRAKLLGEVASAFPHVVSVAGCHGKTSTSAMLAHIFREGKRPFTCHIGGDDPALSNYFSTGGEFFVTEACEFERSFLALKSEIGLILNTDLDHTDCYKDEDDLFSAYLSFAENCEKVVVCDDDLRARHIPHALSFGLGGGDIRAEDLKCVGERYSFTVSERGIPLVRVKMNAVGKVMVTDALAAFAVARLMGFSAEEIKRGIESFCGVGRRFEEIGTLGGVPVICDYAHHPREIAAVLETARKICFGTVRVVFQPHTYTRTRDFLTDFVSVLRAAENPIIYKTYAAREPFLPEGSAYTLVSRLPEAVYVQSPAQLKKRLLEFIEPDDLVLVLGAGDIFEIAKSISDEVPASR